jgi:hypothetical protein
VADHGKKARVHLPLLAGQDFIDRGFHIVVDAALRHAAEHPERVVIAAKLARLSSADPRFLQNGKDRREVVFSFEPDNLGRTIVVRLRSIGSHWTDRRSAKSLFRMIIHPARKGWKCGETLPFHLGPFSVPNQTFGLIPFSADKGL